MTEHIYSVFVWRKQDGERVTHRRKFKTTWGAARFAANTSSEEGVVRCTITDDTNVQHEKSISGAPAIGTRIGEYVDGTATTPINHTSEEDTMSSDTGTAVKKPATKPAAKKAAARPAVKRVPASKATSWAEVLAHSDSWLTKVAQGARPNPSTLEGLKHADDSYTRQYISFLTGGRKHPVAACICKISSADGMEARNALRKQIAKHVGVKPKDVRLETPGKRTSKKLAPSAKRAA